MTELALNPRYVAYATAHGRSPGDMLKYDRQRFPGGSMAGFINWSRAQIVAFEKVRPDCFCFGHLIDSDAYTAWLQKEVAHG